MQASQPQAASSGVVSRKVLIVEDEGLIAHDISSRLQALGHQVVGMASTARGAIELAPSAEIVLMDIHIDGPRDGIEAAAEIRERFRIPVVFLTAYADRGTLDRAKIAEPFAYIVKPLSHATLNTSIEIALYKHRMERMLEEREAWLRTILASIGDAVIVTDPDGRVLMLNPAAEKITACVLPDAQGQPLANIASLVEHGTETGAEHEDAAEPVALAILRDAPVPLDRNWRLTARNGREMRIEGTVAPVKASGQAIGAVMSFRDVSAREWEERQLRQTQKMEAAGRLAASVANEYSNLLATMRNQAEHLLRQFSEYSPAKRAAEEIQQAAAAAEQINRRLSAFGTRQVGHQEVMSLNSLLRKATRLIESVTGPRVEVTIRAKPATGRVKIDAAQIEQAIMTLVIHATAAMAQGGRMLIETGNAELPGQGRGSSFVTLNISYDGPEADPEKLFEPAAAGDEGLALSMVHSIVVEHGGYISAQRIGESRCRFEMLLPRQAGLALLPQPATPNARAILLVEDRDRVRLQLHNFFEASGYNLLEAADVVEAMAIAQMHEGGLDLLIANAAQADAIAAALEADARPRILRIVEGAESGADEIRRPFSQQTLLAKVQSLLSPAKEIEPNPGWVGLIREAPTMSRD
jgi:two-component system cell cycle sensor histidine kinase/response regulator CckA